MTRQATTADADAVLTIHGRAWVSTDRSLVLTGRLGSGDCLVCEIEGHVVGFTTINPRSFFGRDFIELRVVDAEQRREGIGSELLHAFVHQATTPEMFTSTNCSNLPTRNLLRKVCWRFSGELDGIDDGDPEVVFYRSSVA